MVRCVIISSLLTSAFFLFTLFIHFLFGPEEAHKCFLVRYFFRYKRTNLLWDSPFTCQHNQLPNVIVKQDGFLCECVSCCSGVTSVWRCFSMQIHCYSIICVNFILYGKSFVFNICKIEELQWVYSDCMLPAIFCAFPNKWLDIICQSPPFAWIIKAEHIKIRNT